MSSQFPIAILNGTSFFFFAARETKHAQRTLLYPLFLKWPFKLFNLKFIVAVCKSKQELIMINLFNCTTEQMKQIQIKYLLYESVSGRCSPVHVGAVPFSRPGVEARLPDGVHGHPC